MDDKLIRVTEAIKYLYTENAPYNKEKPFAEFLTDVVADAINGDDAIMYEMVEIGPCVLCIRVWIDIVLGGFIIRNAKYDINHIKDTMMKYYGNDAFFLAALEISKLNG